MLAWSRLKPLVCWMPSARVMFMLVLWAMASPCVAEQPVATVTALHGSVQVSLQDAGRQAATVGLALRAGDTIEVLAGASVVLTLSDGSQLELGERTNLDLAVLTQEADPKVRKSRLKLWWGRVRAVLSQGHQAHGSSFDVETPNALVGVKFSQPVVTVVYDRKTQTTIIDAVTVEALVTNLQTQRQQLLESGQRGIVRDELIQQVPIPKGPPPEPPAPPAPTPPVGMNTTVFFQTRSSVRQATSVSAPISVGPVGPGATASSGAGSVPIDNASAGGIAETSANPSPGTRPERPERERRIFILHIERQE
jgi:hypothetical protein